MSTSEANLTAVVQIKLPPAVRDRLEELAEKEDRKLGPFARLLLLDSIRRWEMRTKSRKRKRKAS